jgi:hypothetical protein
MRIREHILKARRLAASLGRLDPVEDYEMVIDLRMLTATHLFNAAMHTEGITPVHADHGHSTNPPLDSYLKKPSMEIRDGSAALEEIEHLRPDYVRGGAPYHAEAMERCLIAYEKAMTCFENVLGSRADMPDWAGEAPEERKRAP